MQSVRLEEGRVIVPDEDMIALPDEISGEFITAVFDASPGEPGHVSALHERLSPTERRRFADACEAAGDELATRWAQAAVAWSTVGADGRWDESVFRFCCRLSVNSWLVTDVLATETGIWLARTTDGLKTTQEFEFTYGETIKEHLRKFAEFTTTSAEHVISCLDAGLVERVLFISTVDGAGRYRRIGPAGLESSHWLLRPGEYFISEA